MSFIIQEKKYQNKITSIKILINSLDNPLTLYLVEFSELEYQKISEEQKILINFENFSNYILNLLKQCKSDINHSCHIFVNESPEVLFLIEENVKQKINEKLKIILRKANDEEIKNYMNKIFLELRTNFEETHLLLNEQNIKLDKLNKENILLNDNIKIIEKEKIETINQLVADKNKEINELKNKYIEDSKIKSESVDNEKKNLKDIYENKILELENKIQLLTKNNQILEENKVKNDLIKEDLENKNKTLISEIAILKEENNKIKLEKELINKQNIEFSKTNSELKSKNDILKQEIEESHKNNFDLNIVIDNFKKQIDSNNLNIKSLNNQNLNLTEKIESFRAEINKGNSIIEKLELDLKNKKSKLKAIKQTTETQEQLIRQKENIIIAQNKNIDEYKIEKELKEKEIIDLNKKVNDYINKLKENEKILEENKKMIIYLNKNITDITNAPFNSRTKKQQEFINKYNNLSGTLFQEKNFDEDNYQSFNIILNNKENINYNLEDDLIALPETNFCNYKLSGQLGGTMDKYINRKNFYNTDDLNNKYGEYYENESLLRHKYGNKKDSDINYYLHENENNIDNIIKDLYQNDIKINNNEIIDNNIK